MDVNFALEDYEVARGFVLTCQSYPVTDKVTVDYDQTACECARTLGLDFASPRGGAQRRGFR